MLTRKFRRFQLLSAVRDPGYGRCAPPEPILDCVEVCASGAAFAAQRRTGEARTICGRTGECGERERESDLPSLDLFDKLMAATAVFQTVSL